MITAKQAFEMNYNIHISEDFGFIFFNNPKAGCSTTKATLNLACAARLGVKLEYRQMHDIHAREHNLLKTPKQIGAKRSRKMVADPRVVRSLRAARAGQAASPRPMRASSGATRRSSSA